MNRVAIRRDGREERIMYSVDEGIMDKAGGSTRNKNMETIYWTCGGVANMVNIIIVRFQIIILQTWLQV